MYGTRRGYYIRFRNIILLAMWHQLYVYRKDYSKATQRLLSKSTLTAIHLPVRSHTTTYGPFYLLVSPTVVPSPFKNRGLRIRGSVKCQKGTVIGRLMDILRTEEFVQGWGVTWKGEHYMML